MIKAVYERNRHRLTVEGHAYSGEAGHDLVCASASILAYTLAANMDHLAEFGAVTEPHSEFENGHAVIECSAVDAYQNTVTIVFDAVCAGFELLSENYPDNISFTVEDV